MAFEQVRPQVNFPKLEAEILQLWERTRAFEQSVAQRPKDNPFVFYEGPPTANGRPWQSQPPLRSTRYPRIVL